MAPAITHFLVGASLLLVLVTPIALRYDIDRENAIWLIPIGGVWGLLPDVHHITPVFETQLYALHNAAWMDLFGLHYTLDRQAIRVRYVESVFGAIGLFIVSVAVFWQTGRLRARAVASDGTPDRRLLSLVATAVAAGYGTVALGIAVSIQNGFPTVSALVGRDSVLVGGALLIPIGIGIGLFCGLGLETVLNLEHRTRPLSAALTGGLLGSAGWVGGVVVGVPMVLQISFASDAAPSVPFLHWGSLGGLIVYGTLFGAVYALVYGVFHEGSAKRSVSARGERTRVQKDS
ncbi:hypothetical protein EA462_16045 [Natrarchaeobius halalkaliphilus]|uniref:Uncharacterized protein n=1 Tax=Natrarchaeobius halalkaliphilus TaxID=1679091 RepID=A0A3N6M3H6_9EURY|nr:hypothetical protein [Natrarchaeobius halalkaliphilus]RQG86657.1 hypothetical protein EA462_16045 [Natrarchaeobius halalkaliphilus]